MKTSKALWITTLSLVLAAGCTDDESPLDGGATSGDGATEDGATEDGATEDGSTEDGSTEDGSTDGSTEDGFDRSAYTDVGTDEDLDYAVPEMWVCRPDIEGDECHKNMDATQIAADGTRTVVEHEDATDPEFDCFYVYPTVLLTGAPQMVDFSQAGIDMVNDPLQAQGARFSSMCRMFAPFYRQVGLMNGMPIEGSDPALGAEDVRDAFAHYLEHWNEGRDFVLIGHSQGTRMLVNMIQQDIDDDEEVRDKLLSALLIGGNVQVPEGATVGGTFQNLPLCTAPGERGCVIAYVSYAADSPPGEADRFGIDNVPEADPPTIAACVDPGTLSDNEGAYTASYFRSTINNATFVPDSPLPDDLDTDFAIFSDLFEGECVGKDGFHYLEISLAQEDDDMREPPWRTTPVEQAGFGLHLVDFHIPLGDLLAAVEAQATAASAAETFDAEL